jgi:cystathionine beta-lyase/cystathionine gamma-synthase
MAAATAILASVLKPRDVLLLMAESYYTIRTLVRGFLSEFGIEARLVPTTARLNAAQLRGVKFGGIHTTAERRARWGGDAIGEGFIRLSAGCEHIDDLLADLGGAFDRLRA